MQPIYSRRRYTVGRLLRGSLERGGSTRLRFGTVVRLSHPRHCLLVGRLCFSVPYTYGYETRRHEDWQVRETDDPYRHIFGVIHSSCIDRHSLLVLRASILWPMDVDLEYGDVFEARTAIFVLDAVSRRRTYTRCWETAGIWGFYDQIFNGYDRRYNK